MWKEEKYWKVYLFLRKIFNKMWKKSECAHKPLGDKPFEEKERLYIFQNLFSLFTSSSSWLCLSFIDRYDYSYKSFAMSSLNMTFFHFLIHFFWNMMTLKLDDYSEHIIESGTFSTYRESMIWWMWIQFMFLKIETLFIKLQCYYCWNVSCWLVM